MRIDFDEKSVPPETVRFLERLFGGPLSARFALVGDRAVGVVGGDAMARMKQVVELSRDRGRSLVATKGYKLATRGASDEWKLLFYLSPAAMDYWLERFHPIGQGEVKKRRGPGISFVGRLYGHRLEGELTAPFTEVLLALRRLKAVREAAGSFRVDSRTFQRSLKRK
jgi:hypothetical protein